MWVAVSSRVTRATIRLFIVYIAVICTCVSGVSIHKAPCLRNSRYLSKGCISLLWHSPSRAERSQSRARLPIRLLRTRRAELPSHRTPQIPGQWTQVAGRGFAAAPTGRSGVRQARRDFRQAILSLINSAECPSFGGTRLDGAGWDASMTEGYWYKSAP